MLFAIFAIVVIVLAVLAANVEKTKAAEGDASEEWVVVEIVLEDGATFDGGVCWESDGTAGIAMLDGSCVTPADYDELYSYETLEDTASRTQPTLSVAAEAGVDPEPRASVRPRFFGGVEYPSYAVYVTDAHGSVVSVLF